MTFASGYRMIFNLFKLEQICFIIQSYVIQWCSYQQLL